MKFEELKNLYVKIRNGFLTIFGDIRISKYPMYVSYMPEGYRITGKQTRDIVNTVQNGDVCLRSYVDYLDGLFIPVGESGCSHSGIYFEGKVYHAIAEGVTVCDIMEFARCDRLVIMRPEISKRTLNNAYRLAKQYVGTPYDFDFSGGNRALYCHEFTRSCYPSLKILPMRVKNKLGMTGPETYVADSFYTCPRFSIVKEYN